MGIDEQGRVAGLAQIVLRDPKLERQMGRAAAEIDAAIEIPVWIDERDARHANTSRVWAGRSSLVCSHSCKRASPSVRPTLGFHPVVEDRVLVSVTYQG